MPDIQARLSTRVGDLTASPIRDILAVIDRPGMASFAGGLPSPDAFPDLSDIRVPPTQLQYGPTEGEPALRAQIADQLRARGIKCEVERVLVLSGSQQGIDLVAKLFIDPRTPIAVESPTYLAALQVFRFFGARLTSFAPSSADGLAEVFKDCILAYAIPNFQNPTGKCYSGEQRDRLAHACDATATTLFEDDPYHDLAYDDCDTSPVCSRLKLAAWNYQGSFSKSLAPGLRLGYLACSPDLVAYFVRLKQAADLHSNRISQWLVLQQLTDQSRRRTLAKLVDLYRAKRDLFDRCLRRTFSGLATWQRPAGGLFFWLTLNSAVTIDTRRLLPLALATNVAFMPGEPFFPLPINHSNAMRLNFSHASPADVETGLAVLARLIESQTIAAR